VRWIEAVCHSGTEQIEPSHVATQAQVTQSVLADLNEAIGGQINPAHGQ
jgi:hypothetical protein